MKFTKKILAVSMLVAGLSSASIANAGVLWASDSLSGSGGSVGPGIYELDATTGAVLSSIIGFSAPGTYADALSFAPDGKSIFVLDSSTNADVRQIDLAGNILNQFQVPLDAEGLTILADGTLLIGGGNSSTIASVNPNTGAILSQFTPVTPVYGLASDGTGTIFGLTLGGVIDSYDLLGNHLTSLITSISGTTLGLAYTGSSFFIAATGSTITEVDLGGNTIRSFAGPAAFTEGLDFPEGVQVVNPAPEPATLALMGLGLAGIAMRGRRRKLDTQA